MTSWFVVYTHARAEEKASEHLQRQGYLIYLPRIVRRRRHARYTDFVRKPLFPRYLFVSWDQLQDRWRPIISTVGVCGLVRQGDRPAKVPCGLVEELQAREREGDFEHQAHIQRIKYGDPVRVVDGPFADLVGQFYGMASGERVFVLLNMLGRSVKSQLLSTAIDPA